MKTLDEYNKEIVEKYNNINKTGIECPACGKELLYKDISVEYCTYPPQKDVYCECGYSTCITV